MFPSRLKLTTTVISIPGLALEAGGGFQQVRNFAKTSAMVLTCAGSVFPAEVQRQSNSAPPIATR